MRRMLLLLLLCIGGAAQSGTARASADNGNFLLEHCQAFLRDRNASFSAGWCLGRVSAAHDMWTTFDRRETVRRLCSPEPPPSNDQVARVVTRYLENNPARLHENDIVLIYHAILDAWPCKR